MTEAERSSLLTAAANGDATAFDALVGPLVETGYRLAVSILGGEADAEDALQEATIKAWRNIGKLRDEAALRGWFLTIVANQARSLRRGRWWSLVKLADPERRPEPGGESGPDDEAVRHLDVERALDGLDGDDRTALFLRYYLDLSLAEAAQVLGVSETAAKSRVQRALKRIRPALETVG